MSFEAIKSTAAKILERRDAAAGRGEEATKQALILPMLEALGYDIWNPNEVCPEYDADFAVKKAGQREKVDYAILINGTPRIFIEAKAVDEPLDGHHGQLARYFNALPEVALSVLTNGVEYRFYSDTTTANVQDKEPFYSTRLDRVGEDFAIFKRVSKQVFSAEAIRDFAAELAYTNRVTDFLRQELDLREREPSEAFVRWVLSTGSLYDGRITSSVVERFQPIVKVAMNRVLRAAFERSIAALAGDEKPADEREERRKREVETTEAELEAYAEVRRVFEALPVGVRGSLELSYKDTTAYFGIYIGKVSNWVARVALGPRASWIGFNLENPPACGVEPMPPNAFAKVRYPMSSARDIENVEVVLRAVLEERCRAALETASENA